MDYLQKERYWQDVKCAYENVLEKDKLNGSSILITGATGLIGSFIVDMFRVANGIANANISLWLVSRNIEHLYSRFEKESEYMHFVEADVCEKVELNQDVDYVIHAAANSYPALFKENAYGTILNSVNGTKNLLELSLKLKAGKFLFVSSGEVYGQFSNEVHKETESGAVDITAPRSCYPIGKQVAENMCVCFGEQYHLPISIARLCHTFGPNAVEGDNRAHMQFLRNASKREKIELRSEGLQERSYMYVADSCAALVSILLTGEPGLAYNICSGETMTIRKFAEICAQMVGQTVQQNVTISNNSLENSPIARQVLDGSRLEALGWKNVFSLEEGICHTIEILK